MPSAAHDPSARTTRSRRVRRAFLNYLQDFTDFCDFAPQTCRRSLLPQPRSRPCRPHSALYRRPRHRCRHHCHHLCLRRRHRPSRRPRRLPLPLPPSHPPMRPHSSCARGGALRQHHPHPHHSRRLTRRCPRRLHRPAATVSAAATVAVPVPPSLPPSPRACHTTRSPGRQHPPPAGPDCAWAALTGMPGATSGGLPLRSVVYYSWMCA